MSKTIIKIRDLIFPFETMATMVLAIGQNTVKGVTNGIGY
jgi:hypothetical protein